MAKNRSITAAERAELTNKALEMHKAGIGYRQIGDRLGIAHTTVHKYIKRALMTLATEQKDLSEGYRQLQLQRYQALLTPLYQKAIAGDQGAAEKARRILDSINGLMGLNAPQKIAPTDPTGEKPYDPDSMSKAEREKRIQELQNKLGR